MIKNVLCDEVKEDSRGIVDDFDADDKNDEFFSLMSTSIYLYRLKAAAVGACLTTAVPMHQKPTSAWSRAASSIAVAATVTAPGTVQVKRPETSVVVR